MPKVVFSKDICQVWGADLASTLVNDGEEQDFLDLYERMATTTPPAPVKDGDVIVWEGREYMVLELSDEEQARLSEARSKMMGEPGVDMMICEQTSDLTRHNLLSESEVDERRGREIRL